jgi:hypothetical protein
MTERVHFSKTDIGAEILPILTTGLYRNTLDTLREYIQNSIDAGATGIELVIDPDTVAVVDDGAGMSKVAARNALRLGISEKNPIEDVGFRGIGIYSAFNVCDTLEVFTKAADDKEGYHLRFDFQAIRAQLLAEQERRKNGLPSKLYLEKLLEDTVYVQEDPNHVVENHGTRVVMSGVLSDAYRRLLDWEGVESYLRDVVPLPFHPNFKFGPQIEKKFEEEDYRVVPVILQINDRRENIYRPYTNEMFVHGGRHRPKIFQLRRGATRFGFAWVCINDERKVLKDLSIRGLVIKKFGFSIGNRSYLEPLFTRTVFSRRVTGEIIIQHPNLLPNAARSDFENNSTRQEFQQLLPGLIRQVSDWANEIQQQDKAREVLNDVLHTLGEIAQELPLSRRDKEGLLRYNVRLADQENKLRIHKKQLEAQAALQDHYRTAGQLLKECKTILRDALSRGTTAAKKLESDAVKSVQAEVEAKAAAPTAHEIEAPTDIASVLEAAGLQLSDDLRKALRLFESECILTHLDEAAYKSILAEFREILEERF